MSVVMLCLLIWIGLTIKNWATDESTRPRWVLKLVLMFYPVKYNKMTNTVPFPDSNLVMTLDTHDITAKDCAANCSSTYNCNGFVFDSNAHTCTQVFGDFSKTMTLPKPSNDTYFRQDKNSPKYGFVSQIADYAIAGSSNLIPQRLGTMSTVVDPYLLSNTCISQRTSNCLGFSFTVVDPYQSWLIKNTSNTEATSNVASYVLSQLTTTDWSEATF
jgi:hypothetical protein